MKEEVVNNAEEKEGQQRKEHFEYYVHYLSLQRRNDRWVGEDLVRIDPEETQR